MAITATVSQVSTSGWVVNGNSSDVTGCEELKAAPGTGVNLYLKSVVINSNAAINITIGSGVSSSSVETILVGPIYLAVNTSTPRIVFDPPIQLAANKSLTVDASGSGAITVVAEGFTK